MAINNCCFTITDITTPDPFVTFANGTYFMVCPLSNILGELGDVLITMIDVHHGRQGRDMVVAESIGYWQIQ